MNRSHLPELRWTTDPNTDLRVSAPEGISVFIFFGSNRLGMINKKGTVKQTYCFGSGLCISGKLRWNVIHNRASARFHRELVLALESARTRLAVAMASETKSTPPDRWQYYFETADRTRQFMKRLRKANSDMLHEKQEWIRALESLKHLPAHSKAPRLCQLLREIVSIDD
jgi:hypothetical protein